MSPGSSSFPRRPAGVLLVAFAAVVVSAVTALAFRLPPLSPPWLGSLVATVVFAAPFVIAIVIAMTWARPSYIKDTFLTWRWSDVGLGLGVGLLLRALVELVAPTVGSLGGGFVEFTPLDLAVLVLGAVIISPVVEEIFFRGVAVAAISDLLHPLGRALGGIIAVAISTLVFVMLHALTLGAATTMGALLGPLLVGVAAGILFLLTRRLASALLAHVVFNAIGVALLLV